MQCGLNNGAASTTLNILHAMRLKILETTSFLRKSFPGLFTSRLSWRVINCFYSKSHLLSIRFRYNKIAPKSKRNKEIATTRRKAVTHFHFGLDIKIREFSLQFAVRDGIEFRFGSSGAGEIRHSLRSR